MQIEAHPCCWRRQSAKSAPVLLLGGFAPCIFFFALLQSISTENDIIFVQCFGGLEHLLLDPWGPGGDFSWLLNWSKTFKGWEFGDDNEAKPKQLKYTLKGSRMFLKILQKMHLQTLMRQLRRLFHLETIWTAVKPKAVCLSLWHLTLCSFCPLDPSKVMHGNQVSSFLQTGRKDIPPETRRGTHAFPWVRARTGHKKGLRWWTGHLLPPSQGGFFFSVGCWNFKMGFGGGQFSVSVFRIFKLFVFSPISSC